MIRNTWLILKFNSPPKNLILFPIFLLLAQYLYAQADGRDSRGENQRVRVNNIFIVGNEKTQKNVILREMDIEAGKTYEWNSFVDMVSGDQIKIYNLQLFTEVSLTPLFTADDEVELLVSVKERWYVIPGIIFSLADRNFSEWWINQERDLSRVNYGLRLNHNNVGGRNEKLRLAGQLGFTKAFSLTYIKPHIDREQRHGLSARFNYLANKTIAVRSVNNKQLFYTNRHENTLLKNLNTSLTYTYRGSFYNFHNLTFGFNNTQIHEDVLLQNPNYFSGANKRLRYFFAEYNFKHDQRNNVAYATEGELLNIGVTRYGLFAKDQVGETELSLMANKYVPLNGKFHFVTGLSASAYLSPYQPYTLVRGIGYYPNFIRGYEIHVIEGQQTLAHKNSFRYELLNVTYDISDIMPVEEFSRFPVRAYLSLNFDHGHVNDRNRLPENSLLTNTYLYGYGIGLDLVTFYDQVLRFEYSRNSLGNGGFFINVNAPL